jgi:cell wall-associated NlpC family hydrolase
MRRTFARLFVALTLVLTSQVAFGTASANAAISTKQGNKIISVADNYQGVMYRRGGSTPAGFDCSGYTSYVYKKAIGKTLARTSNGQLRYKSISKSAKRKGDLIIFTHGRRAYHVGIYAGDNKIWHSPRSGQRVQKARIWTSGYVVRRP